MVARRNGLVMLFSIISAAHSKKVHWSRRANFFAAERFQDFDVDSGKALSFQGECKTLPSSVLSSSYAAITFGVFSEIIGEINVVNNICTNITD